MDGRQKKTFGQTNIDAGLAALNSQTGTFEAIRTTSMMVQATYFLPGQGKAWIGGGYGTIYFLNASEMTCTVSPAFCAERSECREYPCPRFHLTMRMWSTPFRERLVSLPNGQALSNSVAKDDCVKVPPATSSTVTDGVLFAPIFAQSAECGAHPPLE